MADPERIYLQPKCCSNEYGDRQWSEDDYVWERDPCCDEPVAYIRSDLHYARVTKLLKANNETLEKYRALKRSQANG